MYGEVGVAAKQIAKLLFWNDREAGRLQRHYRRGARAPVEDHFAEVLPGTLCSKNDFTTLFIADEHFHASRADDVERIGAIAFADDDRILRERFDDPVRLER